MAIEVVNRAIQSFISNAVPFRYSARYLNEGLPRGSHAAAPLVFNYRFSLVEQTPTR
ncbi:hypothetical protein [Paenibacillus phytorum]|uniref:hypothetical protein n=1 Tax=Paenibacillus phytorum TaxID=2654977 RepID=UPI0014918AB8|nr:hypothetical protein [Paenibacillus phytorum]